MRVKRFVGNTVAEAMNKVKRELGAEAVILQTRQFREGGFFGLFGKVKVEVTAAVEDQLVKPTKLPPLMNPYLNPPSGQGGEKSTNESFFKSLEKASDIIDEKRSDVEQSDDLIKARPASLSRELAGERAVERELKSERNQDEGLRKEMESMRQMLESMNHQMSVLHADKRDYPVELVKWADALTERGIGIPFVNKLIQEIQQEIPAEQWLDDKVIRDHLFQLVQKSMPPVEPITLKKEGPCVVALIGPTGVGKTTTIGKLAAGFSIVDRRKVALVTADTYRVAAVEQLKTFGEIIGVPVDVVMTPNGLRETLEKHQDKDLIIVDTAGRSPNHDFHMSELQAFLHKAEADFRILVLSATTQTADQMKIIARFQDLATHILLTKLDETGSAGALMNIFESVRIPVSYLTNGQNVPDDIEAATPERLAKYVLGENYDV